MARGGSDVGGGLRVLGAAGTTFGGTELAAAGDYSRARYSAGDIESSRAFQRGADFDVHRDRRDYDRDGRFIGFSDSGHSASSRAGANAVACGHGALGYQRVGIRVVVLEAGCGRAAESRVQARTHREFISIPANAEPG